MERDKILEILHNVKGKYNTDSQSSIEQESSATAFTEKLKQDIPKDSISVQDIDDTANDEDASDTSLLLKDIFSESNTTDDVHNLAKVLDAMITRRVHAVIKRDIHKIVAEEIDSYISNLGLGKSQKK